MLCSSLLIQLLLTIVLLLHLKMMIPTISAQWLSISGLAESNSPSSVQRAIHDLNCTVGVLDFLGIECVPVTVYRIGRPHPDYHRLLKVVLHTSRFQQGWLGAHLVLDFFLKRGLY